MIEGALKRIGCDSVIGQRIVHGRDAVKEMVVMS